MELQLESLNEGANEGANEGVNEGVSDEIHELMLRRKILNNIYTLTNYLVHNTPVNNNLEKMEVLTTIDDYIETCLENWTP